MAFTEREEARARRDVEGFMGRRRPPADIRDEMDLGYRIDGDDQSLQIFEIRPDWRNSDEKTEVPFAKIKYVRRREIWKIYWRRADGNWHKYEPAAEVGTLEKALEVVDEDEKHCFWG